jgi:hypothetical protein
MSIDLTFRPTSYADFEDPVALAVNGIAGQMRREMVRDMLSAEGAKREGYDEVLGSIQPDILEERADERFIHNLSSVCGPSWMGGEYLPRAKRREVEIARVVLQSVTADVYPMGDDASDSADTIRSALNSLYGVYDECEVLWGPDPILFQGLPGHRAFLRFSMRRHAKPTLRFETRLVHIEADGHLVEVILAAPQLGAPEGLWEELQAIYESLCVRWSHLSPAEAASARAPE